MNDKVNSLLGDESLEKALEASPAPRVTKAQMDERIDDVQFKRLTDTLTHCTITLDNGFMVTGESACVNPANYDQAIGERIAYDNAYGKLWPLFGFLLAEQNHNNKQ